MAGSALVAGDTQFVLRDGTWHQVEPAEPAFDDYMLRVAAGIYWYIGQQGIYQLQDNRWRRVLSWAFECTDPKRPRYHFHLPGDATSYEFTGFTARDAEHAFVAAFAKGRTAVMGTGQSE